MDDKGFEEERSMLLFLLAIVLGIVVIPFLPKKKGVAIGACVIALIIILTGGYLVATAYDEPIISDIRKLEFITTGSEEIGYIYAFDSYFYEDGEISECMKCEATGESKVRFEKSETEETYLVIYEIPLKKRWEFLNIGMKERYEYLFIASDEYFFQDGVDDKNQSEG